MKKERAVWNSELGFVLATAGAAIGIGNIWKFPYLAAQNGGGAFVFIYTLISMTFGVALLICEMAIGRASGQSPYGAFKHLGAKSGVFGLLPVLTALLVMGYYSVAGGWVLRYLFAYLTGTPVQGGSGFSQFAGSTHAIFWMILFIVITALILLGGVTGGIERAGWILMPILLLLLIILAIFCLFIPAKGGFTSFDGLKYFLWPDFSKLTPIVIMKATGQSLFSLSIGMGCIITYGSYLPKTAKIPGAAFKVAGIDVLSSLFAGAVVLPAVFATSSASPSETLLSGPGLMFSAMPEVFNLLPFGNIFGILFFLLVMVAALTSSISIVEVVTAHLSDRHGFSRPFAILCVSLTCVILCVPVSLSMGGNLNIFGKSLFDALNFLCDYLLIPAAALLCCIFVLKTWGIKSAVTEISRSGPFRFSKLWGFCISVISPIGIILVFLIGILMGE